MTIAQILAAIGQIVTAIMLIIIGYMTYRYTKKKGRLTLLKAQLDIRIVPEPVHAFNTAL